VRLRRSSNCDMVGAVRSRKGRMPIAAPERKGRMPIRMPINVGPWVVCHRPPGMPSRFRPRNVRRNNRPRTTCRTLIVSPIVQPCRPRSLSGWLAGWGPFVRKNSDIPRITVAVIRALSSASRLPVCLTFDLFPSVLPAPYVHGRVVAQPNAHAGLTIASASPSLRIVAMRHSWASCPVERRHPAVRSRYGFAFARGPAAGLLP